MLLILPSPVNALPFAVPRFPPLPLFFFSYTLLVPFILSLSHSLSLPLSLSLSLSLSIYLAIHSLALSFTSHRITLFSLLLIHPLPLPILSLCIQQLLKLQEDGTTMVTDIRTAGDARETARRNEELDAARTRWESLVEWQLPHIEM